MLHNTVLINFLVLMAHNFKILVLIAVFLQMGFGCFAQEKTSDTEIKTAIAPQQKLPLQHLVSSEALVFQLRKNYGIYGSVNLTKALWQILSSYSNQQQAQNIWQTTVNQVTENNNHPAQVNLSFSTGKLLSDYTNGMNLNKWTDQRVPLHINRDNIDDFLRHSSELTIYLHLLEVWNLILMDVERQENIRWNEVFLNSLTFFSPPTEDDKTQTATHPSTKKPTKIETQKESSLPLQSVLQWQYHDNLSFSLADIMPELEQNQAIDNPLLVSIIRLALNRSNENFLASAYDWFELSFYLKKNKSSLSEENKTRLEEYIEESDAWFLAKEQQLMQVNTVLAEAIEENIHALKLYYQSDDEGKEDKFPSAYQLIEPSINRYMRNPMRAEIHRKLEVCLNISEEYGPFPQVPITVNQFKGCINDFVAEAQIKNYQRELSGSLTKIDTKQALDRALQLPPWQISNILYAKVAKSACLTESLRLSSPFEWSLAAESLLWFAERWPSYMQSYPQNTPIQTIIQEGEKWQGKLSCLQKSNSEILAEQFDQVTQAWQAVKAQMKQVAKEYNQVNLAQGSDINLLDNANSESNYRVEGANIEACDVQKSCGVHVSLESSRAIYGLFPNHLLLADQLKLGSLKLCYDNVGWQNRRSASTHLDNDSVANYFGHFSFSLKGFYEDELVFERKIVAKEEVKYLFAANSDEVKETYCPLSIVGSNISTTLERGTYGLFPNRLTFLTASRANESKILTENWLGGEEWRDKMISDEARVVSEKQLTDLASVTQQEYQHKAKELQNLVYQLLLKQRLKPTPVQQQLSEEFANMQRMTRLFAAMAYFFQMHDYLTGDQLHGIVHGSDKLPGQEHIITFHKKQLNINQLILNIDENLTKNQIKWNKFTPSGSNGYFNELLFRLKSLQ